MAIGASAAFLAASGTNDGPQPEDSSRPSPSDAAPAECVNVTTNVNLWPQVDVQATKLRS
jgi:hypothetical protein